jgi:hypothetical protein
VPANPAQKPAAPANFTPAQQKAPPAPKTVAVPAPTKPAVQPPAPKLAPEPKQKEARPKKSFPREVSASFQEVSKQYKTSVSLGQGLGKALVLLAQPLLGALPHDAKKKLESAVESPLFSVAGSTGLNILHNGVLYSPWPGYPL